MSQVGFGVGARADATVADPASLAVVELVEADRVTVGRGVQRGQQRGEGYALARARIVLDRLDGGIARILADKARLGADEAFREASGWLDAYANSLYRSIKNHPDGQALAARLDAADSIRFLLELLFALDRRPRPYNKYLEWELDRHPLPGWDTDVLLGVVDRISATGEVALQRHLFTLVETAARGAGHGEVLDAWGEDLDLMRPQ